MGLVTEGSKCCFIADVELQGEQGKSLTVLVHGHGGPNQFGAHGHYEHAQESRYIPIYFAGNDAQRLITLLREAQATSKPSE